MPANGEWSCAGCAQGAAGPRGGAPHPGREILWRRTSKLMPGGHTGFNKERPRRGYPRQRKLRGRGPEARGSWSIPLRMAGGKLLWGGDKR